MSTRIPSLCRNALFALLAASAAGCSSDSGDANSGPSAAAQAVGNQLDQAFAEPRPPAIDLDRLSDANGFSFPFDPVGSESTQSLQGIGDVNGDGIDDFTFNTSMRTWVVQGGGTRLAADLMTGPTDTDTGNVIRLDEGLQLQPLGDLNADGIDDVGWLIYDTEDDMAISGLRVVFGRADGGLADALQGLPDGTNGFVLIDEQRRNDIRSVAPAGDFNADGIDDVLLGAYAYNGEDFDAPNAWVIYGRAGGFAPLLDVASLSATDGLSLETRIDSDQLAAVSDSIGAGYDASVAGNFDLNGDGVDDIAIGASSFDWLRDVGTSRTYVVYGSASRTAAALDMTSLDGVDGVNIAGPDLPYQPSPDGVSAVGDINADGFADLGILDEAYAGGVARVLFGGFAGADSRIDRTSLQPSTSIEFRVESGFRQRILLSSAGDIDADGIDDLAARTDDTSLILYGNAESFPGSIDLSAPPAASVTQLDGSDGAPMVALGDINGDGIDDLGVGWSSRVINAGISVSEDINQDGVDDIGISEYQLDMLNQLRVLYGFGSDGYVQFPPDPSAPEPLKYIDPFFFNRLLAAVDAAARSPLNYLNDTLAGGEMLSPVAQNCVGALDGAPMDDPMDDPTSAAASSPMMGSVAPDEAEAGAAQVEAFDCGAEPLSFSFTWGDGKYSGTAGGNFTRVALVDGAVQSLQYSSFPVPIEGPGGNPYQAHLSFERDGEFVVGSHDYLENPLAPRCAIDVATGQTSDDETDCAILIGDTRDVLMRVFGTRSDVDDFQFEPQ